MTGPEFKSKRERLALTQRALADKLGITVTTISNYETGRQPVPELARLALLAVAADLDRTQPRS